MMNVNFEALKSELYTAVLSDVLDSFGYRHQAMRPFIRPLDDTKMMFGRARTGLYMNTYSVASGENPYEIEIELVDDLKPGDVAVFDCGGPTERIAPWGELLSTACCKRGAAGCVTDGLVRDVRLIRELGFPVCHGGIGPRDSAGRGKWMARDGPASGGGVEVTSGDLIFGDVDGVVIIPQAIAEKVIEAAIAKIRHENVTREELKRGLLLGEVYRKYGVL